MLTAGIIPTNTTILIDEFHDFMKLPAIVTANRISCPYKFAAASQVLGLSATFGGDQVKVDISKLFPGSSFINTSQ